MTYAELVEEIARPGFPAMTKLPSTRREMLLRGYIEELARTDVPRLTDMRHDPSVIVQLIASLARNTACDVTYATLASDVHQVAPSIKGETIAKYVSALERLFVVERQKPWTPALRSRARLRSPAKLHLADPALAVVGLGANAERLRKDPEAVGLLFESAVYHDVSVYSDLLGGEVRHFRDSNGHEIDIVITMPNGSWGAVEVKLGSGQIESGSTNLAQAVAQIDHTSVAEPVFRLVVTGTGPTAVLSDGTITCPLMALRP